MGPSHVGRKMQTSGGGDSNPFLKRQVNDEQNKGIVIEAKYKSEIR